MGESDTDSNAFVAASSHRLNQAILLFLAFLIAAHGIMLIVNVYQRNVTECGYQCELDYPIRFHAIIIVVALFTAGFPFFLRSDDSWLHKSATIRIAIILLVIISYIYLIVPINRGYNYLYSRDSIYHFLVYPPESGVIMLLTIIGGLMLLLLSLLPRFMPLRSTFANTRIFRRVTVAMAIVMVLHVFYPVVEAQLLTNCENRYPQGSCYLLYPQYALILVLLLYGCSIVTLSLLWLREMMGSSVASQNILTSSITFRYTVTQRMLVIAIVLLCTTYIAFFFGVAPFFSYCGTFSRNNFGGSTCNSIRLLGASITFLIGLLLVSFLAVTMLARKKSFDIYTAFQRLLILGIVLVSVGYGVFFIGVIFFYDDCGVTYSDAWSGCMWARVGGFGIALIINIFLGALLFISYIVRRKSRVHK